MVNFEDLDTLFLVSFFRRRISESVKPSDSNPETPTLSKPPTTSTSLSSTSASLPASVSHTPVSSNAPSGPSTGLYLPLSNNFLFRDIKRKTAARTTDSVSAWDELMSSTRMTLFLEMLRIEIRRTWLTGYYMVEL